MHTGIKINPKNMILNVKKKKEKMQKATNYIIPLT